MNRMETPNQTPPSSPLPDDCYAYMNSEPVLDKDELKALLIEVVKKVVKKGEKDSGEKLIFEGKAIEREVLKHRKALELGGWRLQEGGGWRIEHGSGSTWQSLFAQIYNECDPQIKDKMNMGNQINLGRYNKGLKRRRAHVEDCGEMLKWGIFPSLACISYHKGGVEGGVEEDWAPMTRDEWKRILEKCLANKENGNYNWTPKDLKILRPRHKKPVKAKRELSFASKVKAQINYQRLAKTLAPVNKTNVRNLTAKGEVIRTCNDLEKLEQRGANLGYQERNHSKEDEYNTLLSMKMDEGITDLEKTPTDLVKMKIRDKVKQGISYKQALEEAQQKHNNQEPQQKDNNQEIKFKNTSSQVKLFKQCNICYLAGKSVIFQSQKKKKHIVKFHGDSFELEDLTNKELCPIIFPVVKILHPSNIQ